jgi:hypothetical protein
VRECHAGSFQPLFDLAVHVSEAERRIELRHDTGQFDHVLDASLGSRRNEV